MTSLGPNPHRPAGISRWVVSGFTAAVAVGSVAAMTEGASDDSTTTGDAFGAVARYRGEVFASELMAAADAGDEIAPEPTLPRLGSAGVS